MKWQLVWRRSSSNFSITGGIVPCVKLIPNEEFKEKLGDVWIAPICIKICKDCCNVPVQSDANSIVLSRSNSYQNDLVLENSLLKAELHWCCNEVSIEVDIVLVRNTFEIIKEVKIPPSTEFHDFSALIASDESESKRKFCDLTFTATTTEGEGDLPLQVNFYAHKAILAARSPVFAKMFSHDMQESATNTIQLTDIEPDVLKELLTYIYTGECPNIKRHAESLLHHAEKYQLPHLKCLCEQRLSYDLQVKNAGRFLLLADSHGAKQLRQNALQFIGQHAGVQQTTEWKDAVSKNAELLRDLVQVMHMQAGHVL